MNRELPADPSRNVRTTSSRRVDGPRAVPGEPPRLHEVPTHRGSGLGRPRGESIVHTLKFPDSAAPQRSAPTLESRVAAWTGAPARRASLVGYLRTRAVKRPGDAALVNVVDDLSPSTTITYGELDQRARAIAAVFQDGCLAGDRIVLAYRPGLEFIAAYFGVLPAG